MLFFFDSKPDILPGINQPTLHATFNHHNLTSYVARHRRRCQDQNLVCDFQRSSYLPERSPGDPGGQIQPRIHPSPRPRKHSRCQYSVNYLRVRQRLCGHWGPHHSRCYTIHSPFRCDLDELVLQRQGKAVHHGWSFIRNPLKLAWWGQPTALCHAIIRVSSLSILPSSASNENDCSLILQTAPIFSQTFQTFEILPDNQERRGQVRIDSPIPLP